MGEQLPSGRRRRMTDDELRAAVAEKLSDQEVADRFGLSRQGVQKRRKQLGVVTVSAATAPEESRRFVEQRILEIDLLYAGMEHVHRMLRACHEWLKHPEDEEEYTLEPRASEMWIIHEVAAGIGPEGEPRFEKKREKLSDLLSRLSDWGLCENCGKTLEKSAPPLPAGYESWEVKVADPRKLLLDTARELRQTINTAADIARMLADARATAAFMDSLLAEIAKVDPIIAERIALAINRSIVLRAAFDGHRALPPAGGGD